MIRKIAAFFLSAAMIFSLTACGNDTSGQEEESANTVESEQVIADEDIETLPIIWQEDAEYDEDLPYAYYANEYILVDESAPVNYAALVDAMYEVRESLKLEVSTGWEQLENAVSGTESDEESYIRNQAYVRRADSRALSVLYITKGHIGSTDSNSYAFAGLNFDPLTGKQLALSDVVSDEDALLKAAAEQLELSYADWSSAHSAEDVTGLTAEQREMIAWTLDREGITLIFANLFNEDGNDNEEGNDTFYNIFLPFSQYTDLFNSQYTVTTDQCAVMLSDMIPYYDDINSDGEPEQISYATEEEYDTLISHKFTVSKNRDDASEARDNLSLEEDISCYRSIPLLVDNWGTYYIYDEMQHEDECYETEVLAFNNNEPVVLDSVGAGFMRITEDNSEDLAGAVVLPYDVTEIQMQVRTNVLSTAPAVFLCSTNGTGVPEIANDAVGQIDENITFTAKKEIKATEIDMTTFEEFGETTIPAGTKLTYVFTDNKRTAYLQGDNKTAYKVTLDADCDTYPQEIDGVPTEELLDGISMAG